MLFASSPAPKGQLTRNLVGSIRVTCIIKLLKSFLSEIQDGRHDRYLGNLLWAFTPEPKGQLTRNLIESIKVICRYKIAKIIPAGNPKWPPSWKSILRFFSGTERPNDSKNPRWSPWLLSWKCISRFFS